MAEDSNRARASTTRRAGELLIGRLAAHGRANYQFRATEEPSYYLKLLTSRGERTLWGKDLERAIRTAETKPNIGDLIGARRTGREAVTVIDRRRDAAGNVVAQSEHHAHRNSWEVEKLQFFSDRAKQARLARDEHLDTREAVRQRPELRSTFLSLRAAEQLAAERIANPEDRERFINMVRDAIAASVQRGEPLPDRHLRKKSPPDPSPATPSQKRGRDEPTR